MPSPPLFLGSSSIAVRTRPASFVFPTAVAFEARLVGYFVHNLTVLAAADGAFGVRQVAKRATPRNRSTASGTDHMPSSYRLRFSFFVALEEVRHIDASSHASRAPIRDHAAVLPASVR